MSSTLKVDILQDSGGNNIIASDGSGSLTTQKILYPAFEAYLSADQSVSDVTTTKVEFDTKAFDTDNCYDNTTNYRFTPTVAGKYFVYSIVTGRDLGNDLLRTDAYIYKNGDDVIGGIIYPNTNSPGNKFGTPVYGTVDMNGSTDYLEIFTYLDYNGSAGVVDGSSTRISNFGAYRIGD